MAAICQLDTKNNYTSFSQSRVIFAQNLFHNGQLVGPVNNTMQLLHISNKVPYSDTLERFIFLEKQRKGTK